jgi:hypothetical protein
MKNIIFSIFSLAFIVVVTALLISSLKKSGFAIGLPEEQRRVLSDLRKEWRYMDRHSEQIVRIKTCYFLFRHWWGISWSEIGKYIKGLLPSRWI